MCGAQSGSEIDGVAGSESAGPSVCHTITHHSSLQLCPVSREQLHPDTSQGCREERRETGGGKEAQEKGRRRQGVQVLLPRIVTHALTRPWLPVSYFLIRKLALISTLLSLVSGGEEAG